MATRSARLPSRSRLAKNMTELQRYSLFVTYCVYAKRDQSAAPSAPGTSPGGWGDSGRPGISCWRCGTTRES